MFAAHRKTFYCEFADPCVIFSFELIKTLRFETFLRETTAKHGSVSTELELRSEKEKSITLWKITTSYGRYGMYERCSYIKYISSLKPIE